MKTKILLLLFILFSGVCKSQIYQMNLLGKVWNIHGIDYKAMIQDPAPKSFMLKILAEADFNINHELKDYMIKNFEYAKWNVQLLPFRGHSLGLTFRPFYLSNINIIKSIEFGHSINYLKNYAIGEFNRAQFIYKSDNLGYNFSTSISSNSFGEVLKAYILGDAGYLGHFGSDIFISNENIPVKYHKDMAERTFKADPIQRTINTQINASLYQKLFTSSFAFGLKTKISCKWNLHVELRFQRQYYYFENVDNGIESFRNQLRFGVRYKLGAIEESLPSGEEEAEGPVFW